MSMVSVAVALLVLFMGAHAARARPLLRNEPRCSRGRDLVNFGLICPGVRIVPDRSCLVQTEQPSPTMKTHIHRLHAIAPNR